jgi:hypothetical protein
MISGGGRPGPEEPGRFRCTLTIADEPPCESYARVTIADVTGETARGCPRHAVAALDGIAGAPVDWAESRGLNEFGRMALELSGERSLLAARPEAKAGL